MIAGLFSICFRWFASDYQCLCSGPLWSYLSFFLWSLACVLSVLVCLSFFLWSLPRVLSVLVCLSFFCGRWHVYCLSWFVCLFSVVYLGLFVFFFCGRWHVYCLSWFVCLFSEVVGMCTLCLGLFVLFVVVGMCTSCLGLFVFFLWSLACVLSVLVCLLFLLVSLVDYDLWLWPYLP